MAPAPNQPVNVSLETLKGMAPAAQIATSLGTLSVVVVLFVAFSVVRAALAPQMGEVSVTDLDPRMVEQYAIALEANHDFLDSRSPFFPPRDPSEKVDVPEERVEPPAGSRYAGPKLCGIFGEYAHFESEVTSDDRKYLRVGESGREISLVRILSPISVEVRWRGRDWAVALFEDGNIELEGGGGQQPFEFLGSGDNRNRINTLDLSGGGSSDQGLFIPVENNNQRTGPARPRSPAANN